MQDMIAFDMPVGSVQLLSLQHVAHVVAPSLLKTGHDLHQHRLYIDNFATSPNEHLILAKVR